MSTSTEKISADTSAVYDSFAAYVQEHQESFYRLAYSYVKNEHTALDMIQNAIYSALKSIHTLKEPSYMKTWFYRILVNTCLDELRKNKHTVATDPQELPDQPDLTAEPDDQIIYLDLYRALDKLSPSAKTIVTLRYFEDMKLSQVAEILGENLSTVKTKLYRALEKLKIQLDEEVYINE